MLTYIQFAERLARGQLKNTAAVENTNLGEICPDYVDTVLSLTNQGLVDISTRLPLIKRLVDLTFVAGQNVYALAVAGSTGQAQKAPKTQVSQRRTLLDTGGYTT